MLSDDVYRAKLQATVADIKRTVENLSDVCSAELRHEPSRLRVALTPTVKGACPLEVLVRADQRFDIEIGSEFYQDCEISSLDELAALIKAVTAGNVVTRHYFSNRTGTLRAVETVVDMASGSQWRRSHRISSHEGGALQTSIGAQDDEVVKDRTFLPYRRA